MAVVAYLAGVAMATEVEATAMAAVATATEVEATAMAAVAAEGC